MKKKLKNYRECLFVEYDPGLTRTPDNTLALAPQNATTDDSVNHDRPNLNV